MRSEPRKRLRRDNSRVDGVNFILRDENAVRYECGFGCDNVIYIRLGSEARLITDGRYAEDAERKAHGVEVTVSSDILSTAVKILKKSGISSCILDPREWDISSYELLKKSGVRWIYEKDFSHRRRVIKSREEIKYLSKAAKLGAKAFDEMSRLFECKGIGRDERYLAMLAEKALRKGGRYGLSFDPIVAIGPSSARPHAVPSDRKLKYGRLLLVDAGLRYRGYCSDRTRTVAVDRGFDFGYEQKFSSKREKKIYDIVLEAHDRAIAGARSGMRASKIDALARKVIEKAGYGDLFLHSTGHGVGLDIHEMPYISPKSDTVVEDGMVFTIEPGIYIPGEFGVRIEDTIVMRDGRAEVL